MAPAQSQDKSLSPDQVKLLCEVITQAKVALTPTQWNDIASNLGISNGKAAKERFRYMMNSLSGVPTRAAKSDDGVKGPSTPKSTTKKTKAPSTPAPRKEKAGKESAKKRKLADVDQEESTVTNGKDNDVEVDADADDEKSASKTPKAKKVKKLDTPFRTPKKVKKQQDEDSDGTEAGSDTTKVEASMYSGTTQTQTPTAELDPNTSDTKNLDIETYFQEEGFGTIGGGEGSMFPDDHEDLI